MGTTSVMHWVVVLAVILIIFGAGRLPGVMGDVAKGIRSFKRTMREEEAPPQVGKTDARHPPGEA